MNYIGLYIAVNIDLLQLGGKNAAVIFGDADLEKVVPTTVRLESSRTETYM